MRPETESLEGLGGQSRKGQRCNARVALVFLLSDRKDFLLSDRKDKDSG